VILTLDTSAVIGWLELDDRRIADRIEQSSEIPTVAWAVLGELSHAVIAMSGNNEKHAIVATTARFVFQKLPIYYPTTFADLEIYGILSATTGRRLSHNDKWIITTTIILGAELITQDVAIVERTQENKELARMLGNTLYEMPKITLIPR
jgi:predicted nucleic acid-binding protein